MYRTEWFKKNKFDNRGFTYCILGEDTYAIKDRLKELGFRYSPVLKWHTDNAEIPSEFNDYKLLPICFDDVLEWNDEDGNAYFKTTADKYVEQLMRKELPPSTSVSYPAAIGDRFYSLTAIFKSRRGYNSMYGWQNIYTFTSGDYVFTWFTQVELDIDTGSLVNLTGTIKKFEEFRGVNTTVISRAVVSPIR